MRTMGFARKTGWVLGAFAAVALAGVAHAGFSAKVQKKFKGQILITESDLDLQAGGSDEDTIKHCEKQNLAVVKSYENADGIPTWRFYYTAFMKKKPGVRALSLDFYTDDKEQLYVANKKMLGIDPGLTTLQGRVIITEDDGLLKNRAYIVKLAAEVKGKEVVLATTKLKTK